MGFPRASPQPSQKIMKEYAVIAGSHRLPSVRQYATIVFFRYTFYRPRLRRIDLRDL